MTNTTTTTSDDATTTTTTKKTRSAAANSTANHQSYTTGVSRGDAPEPHRRHDPAILTKTSITGPKVHHTMGPVTLSKAEADAEDVKDDPAEEEEAGMEEGTRGYTESLATN